jgi:ferredoxin
MAILLLYAHIPRTCSIERFRENLLPGAVLWTSVYRLYRLLLHTRFDCTFHSKCTLGFFRVMPSRFETSFSCKATAARGPSLAPRPVRAMSSLRDPRQGNVEGQFFVDRTCIDCDTCRWMAPDTFSRVGDGSAAVRQPADREARIVAMQATLSCPTCVVAGRGILCYCSSFSCRRFGTHTMLSVTFLPRIFVWSLDV